MWNSSYFYVGKCVFNTFACYLFSNEHVHWSIPFKLRKWNTFFENQVSIEKKVLYSLQIWAENPSCVILWNSPVNFIFQFPWLLIYVFPIIQYENQYKQLTSLNLINFEFYCLFTHNAFSTIAWQWLGKTVIVYRMYIIRICVIVFLFQIKYFTKLYFVFISPFESPGELVLLTVLLIFFLAPLSIKL